MVLDNLDMDILRILSANGRESYRKIAKELEVSTVTIMNRVNKLVKGGVIKNFTITLDSPVAGYPVCALIRIIARRKHLVELMKKFAKHPNVCGVYDVTGEFDAVIVTKFKNVQLLNKFLKEMPSEWLDRSYTEVVLNIHKEDFSFHF